MPECANYRHYAEREFLSRYPYETDTNPEYDRQPCAWCGAPLEKEQSVCLRCRRPRRAEQGRAGKKRAISGALFYGLVFHGFMAGLGLLVIIGLAVHYLV